MYALSKGLKLTSEKLKPFFRFTFNVLKKLAKLISKIALKIITHPIKSLFFVVKLYLIMMLLVFFMVFSTGSFAEIGPESCEAGETWLPSRQACAIVAPEQSCEMINIRAGYPLGQSTYPTLSAYQAALADKTETYENHSCTGLGVDGYRDVASKVIYTSSLTTKCPSPLPPDGGTVTKQEEATITITTERVRTTRRSYYEGHILINKCEISPASSTTTNQSVVIPVDYRASEEVECPLTHPIGPSSASPPHDLNQWCWRIPTEDCDCSDLEGQEPQGFNYFYALAGTYSQSSPPNCLNKNNNEESDSSCDCKFIATKWTSSDVNIGGVAYQRWQPVPDGSGVTGVYTGGQCTPEEKEIEPDEPEQCFTQGNGQKVCLEDPNKKCAKIDGVVTCQSGCGYINGEFFCFENDDPDNPLPDPDDEITDPDKPLNLMTKGDFKQVQRGNETRLDILGQLIKKSNANESEMLAKAGTTNKLLKEISDKIDELGEDKETPTNPQPSGNQDILDAYLEANSMGDKTFESVTEDFKNRIMQAPIMDTVSDFFTVSLSGSCPTWSATVSMPHGGTFNINLDQLCSETMTSIWPSIRAILILIFTVLGFRVAFLNE